MREPQFEPGTILADKYRLDSRLGEGGMGTVYQATHLLLKAPVAIKVIDREVSEGEVALSRFMREAQAAASLRSPHVVQVLDYGTERGRPFMVMELLEGESLADRIDRLGRLTPHETFRVLSHVARAMARAHEAGIIHRDLKPDNVFLVHNEGDELAKVLDFGVAKVEATALGEGGHTRTGSLLGTPYYMSPEQAQGNKEVDYRSDLWALGVIAFECLTGKRPFYSEGLGEVVLQICIRDIPRPSDFGQVPPGFDDWFARATERDVTTRFQSAREMIEALGAALGVQKETFPGMEGPWSTAAPMQKVPAHSKRAPEEATTERDRTSESDAPNERPTSPEEGERSSPRPEAESPLPSRLHRTEGEGGARWEESVDPPSALNVDDAPKDSQWEIVPHEETEQLPAPARNLALELALAEEKRRPSTIFLVGILFLMLGASGMLMFRSFVGGSDTDGRRLAPQAAPKVSPPQGGITAPEGTVDEGGPSLGTSPAAGQERSNQSPGAEDGSADPTSESDALDAIDALAAEKAGQQTEGSDTEDPEGSEAESGSSTGKGAETTGTKPQDKAAGAATGSGKKTEPAGKKAEPNPDAAGAEPSPRATPSPKPTEKIPDGSSSETEEPAPGPEPKVPPELAPIPPPPPAP